jgi:hypothetical protein
MADSVSGAVVVIQTRWAGTLASQTDFIAAAIWIDLAGRFGLADRLAVSLPTCSAVGAVLIVFAFGNALAGRSAVGCPAIETLRTFRAGGSAPGPAPTVVSADEAARAVGVRGAFDRNAPSCGLVTTLSR